MEKKGCIPYAVCFVNFVSAKANKRQVRSTAQQQVFALRHGCCCSLSTILQSNTMLTLQSVAKSCIAATESCRCIRAQGPTNIPATQFRVEDNTCVLPVLPTGAGPFHTPVRSCKVKDSHRAVMPTQAFHAKCATQGQAYLSKGSCRPRGTQTSTRLHPCKDSTQPATPPEVDMENHSLGIIIYYKDHLGVSAAHSFERPGLCLSGDEAGRRMLGQSMLVTGSRRWPC